MSIGLVSAYNYCLYVCQEVTATADVAVLWDSLVYNSGFVAVIPTRNSERLCRTMKSITSKSSTKYDDQTVLNLATEVLRKQNTGLMLAYRSEQKPVSLRTRVF